MPGVGRGTRAGRVLIMVDKAYKTPGEIKKIFPGGKLDPAKFTPSYYEWLSTRGKRIAVHVGTANAKKTVYECPLDKTAFITSYSVAVNQSSGIAVVEQFLRLNDEFLFVLESTGVAGSFQSMVSNPSIPLILKVKDNITAESQDVGIDMHGNVLGFEIDNKDFLEF